MRLAAENPGVEYLSSQVCWIHSSGYSRTIGGPWEWRCFSKFMCTAHAGSMHRRDLFSRLGIYDTTYRSAADYELLLRARQGLKAGYVPISTVMMRGGGVSDSAAAFPLVSIVVTYRTVLELPPLLGSIFQSQPYIGSSRF
jgi:hypothetical protein